MSLTLRTAVIQTAQAMSAAGLSVGTSGNVSVRGRRGFFITPTGMPYASLRPHDIAEVDWKGRAEGSRLPSSEWRMHLDVFAARPEVSAIVHCHPPHGTSLSCLRREIPAFHYMVAVAGGSSIRCARYETFGTSELAAAAVEALQDRRACLLANHGMLSLGATAQDALKLAVEVENLAGQYLHALSVGEPVVLDDAEMRLILEKFRTYGQQRPRLVWSSGK